MRLISSRSSDLPYSLSAEEPLRTYGALSAIAGPTETGRLPGNWKALYEASREAGTIRYTVLSYGTPIAWTTADGWLFVPQVKYSVTTSKHQGKLYRLINTYGDRVVRVPSDLGAPASEGRDIPLMSGEGAIYSPEYLRQKSAAMS